MHRVLRAAHKLLLALSIAAALPSGAGAEANGAEANGAEPALLWLDAIVNDQHSSGPVLFLRGKDGALYASSESLSSWRLRLPEGEPLMFDGALYYRLDARSGYRIALSEPEQSVRIDASAGAFAPQRADLVQDEIMPMTVPGTGAFLDYDIMVDHVRGETAINGFARVGIFTPHGAGESSFIASAGSSGSHFTRLESSWTIDRPSDATTLRIGDSIAFGGSAGAPYRFAGLHFFRNFAVQPGFITMPMATTAGSVSIPSVVDVFVNNALQSSQQIAPGPFEIANIPLQTGSGTVSLVVRDLLGREVVQEQSYYASSLMLRRGLHEYSYELGFVRKDFGRRGNRYGSLMAATTHRYGINDHMSGEMHLQVSAKQQMASAGLNLILFDLAQVNGSLAVSNGEKGLGYRLAGSIESRGRRLSAGLRAEFVDPGFAFIGSGEHRLARFTAQAFADLPLARGAVGMNMLHRSYRDRPSETIAGLSETFQLTPGASIGLNARHVVSGRKDTMFGLHLAIALGGRRSASVGIENGRRGLSALVGFQNDPPAGTGGGYRVSASLGQIDRFEAGYAYNLPMASLSGQIGHSNGATGLRVSAAGSIGYMAGRPFAARSLGDSFASVDVAGFPGLRVYADERLVGLTQGTGSLVIPGLRPFERNRIRIESSDLPIDARVDAHEISVRPFARSGTVVRFSVVRERGARLRISLEDGRKLPAGTIVTGDDGEEHVTVAGGEIYVPRPATSMKFRARMGENWCGFTASMPVNDDPQPLIGGLICKEELRLAAS